MKDALNSNTYGLTFDVDWAGYQCADRPEHYYPVPRYIYYVPDLLPGGVYDDITYCGEGEPGGPCGPAVILNDTMLMDRLRGYPQGVFPV